MTVDFNHPVLLNPADGSYIVTTQGPAYPYNILPDDPMWQSIQDWLAAGNVAIPYVPPVAAIPNPVTVAQQTLAQMTQAAINNLVAVPNATAFGATFIQQWKAAWKAAGN